MLIAVVRRPGGEMKVACAVIGTGNIGTDLLYKLQRSPALELRAIVGIDPGSEGLARARRLGVDASPAGIDWLLDSDDDVRIVFEATSAAVHARHAPLLREAGIRVVDLTPAAVGPGVVPSVNLDTHLDEPNVNLVTCGGQATVPIVAAVNKVAPVRYAEIVSTVASRSAGPGTRRNIDEFTLITARSLRDIGGAQLGKAIIVLNPAEPPIVMRNTVYCALDEGYDRDAVTVAVQSIVAEVGRYVPGYRLKSPPIFDTGSFPAVGAGGRVTVLLEVEGAGDFLPAYAGNLDIMTSAAVRVGERLADAMTRAGADHER
jgi:acetaldehyde dehydrogenase